MLQTYNMDAQIGESSACATALMCGVKTNYETVGLDSRGRFENCYSSFSSRVSSLIDWAQESGKRCSCFSQHYGKCTDKQPIFCERLNSWPLPLNRRNSLFYFLFFSDINFMRKRAIHFLKCK